jgi:hypothetical protein
MTEKHFLFSLVGGLVSMALGGFLTGLIAAAIIGVSGDDRVLLYNFAGAVSLGIAGLLFSIKWVRKHIKPY